MTTKAISQDLAKDGICICPNYLSPTVWQTIRADLDFCFQQGEFKRAGTGQGSGRDVRDLVRRDEILWLDQTQSNRAQSLIWSHLEELKTEFNRSLYLGLQSFEGHYAAYPEGGFYKRHLDCFKQSDDRVVSIILYLNQNWKPVDGGQLRIFQNESHLDVDPSGGTLVCFMSREKEHEVLLSHAPRFSFSGWFKVNSTIP